ncbi:hypothetical protein MHPYR_120019 [uncultured Mycobacterium sp.]|uniref:Uncharacterized protein n=1 Tax=uncultured Mycobacterium sp. TaxID=171292 RepID=A0A1Y5P6G7_9MYCO|nr:hypothetical protein MHPYR_120019 [uncultured Mycobacterium sp.]
MRCELGVYHLSPFSLVGQDRQLMASRLRKKLGGIADAKKVPVVRVLPDSPLSGSVKLSSPFEV